MQKREGLPRGAPWGSRNTAHDPEARKKIGPQLRHISKEGKSAFESDSKKNWSKIETEVGAEQGEAVLEVSLVRIRQKERSTTFAWIERKTPVLRSISAPIETELLV